MQSRQADDRQTGDRQTDISDRTLLVVTPLEKQTGLLLGLQLYHWDSVNLIV